jgi:hypothetical protein
MIFSPSLLSLSPVDLDQNPNPRNLRPTVGKTLIFTKLKENPFRSGPISGKNPESGTHALISQTLVAPEKPAFHRSENHDTLVNPRTQLENQTPNLDPVRGIVDRTLLSSLGDLSLGLRELS